MTSDDLPRERKHRLHRLTSARVIGWPLILSSLVVFLVDAFPFLGGSSLDGARINRFSLVVQAVLFGHVLTTVVLLFARFTWLKLRVARRRPGITVATFFLAALLGDSVFQSVVVANLEDNSLPSSMSHGVIFKTVVLVILGHLIVGVDEYRSRVRDLEESRTALTASRLRATEIEEEEIHFVIEKVNSALTSAQSALREEDPADAARIIRSISRGAVRPLSHDLASTRPTIGTPVVDALPRPRWSTTFRRVFDSPLIAPHTMAVIMMALSFRLTIAPAPQDTLPTDEAVAVTLDLRSLVEAVAILALVYFATYLPARAISATLPPFLAGRTALRRALTNTVAVIASALATLGIIVVIFQLPFFLEKPEFTAWTPLLTIVPLLAITFIHGLLRSVGIRQSESIDNLVNANRDLKWELASINERLWHNRLARAKDVHGPIQARLNAAAIRLEEVSMLEAPDPQRAATLAETKTLLAEAAQVLTASTGESVDVESAISQLARLWTGVCEIEFLCPPDVGAALSTDRACASAVVTVTEEACANAITHGKASRISVAIRLHDQQIVRLTVTDNGSEHPAESLPGFGSQLLDDISIEWALTRTPDSSVLQVELPVEP